MLVALDTLGEPAVRELKTDDSQSCGLVTGSVRYLDLVDEGFHFTLHENYRSDTDFDRSVSLVFNEQTWTNTRSSQLRVDKKGKRVMGSLMADFGDYGPMGLSVSFNLPRCKSVPEPAPAQ